jgi:hypothetical protein
MTLKSKIQAQNKIVSYPQRNALFLLFTRLISAPPIVFTQRESEATYAADANLYHMSLPIHQPSEHYTRNVCLTVLPVTSYRLHTSQTCQLPTENSKGVALHTGSQYYFKAFRPRNTKLCRSGQ